MCGIFGYIGNKRNAAEIVFERLKLLEYRGYDSWGVGVVTDTKSPRVVVQKKVGKIGNSNVKKLPSGNLAFGHTRWATHGGVTNLNAHPHLDCKKQIAVVHNGIFENYGDIKENLKKKGHKFTSQTDTEVIAHLIEEFNKKASFPKSVLLAFNKIKGLNAIIATSIKEKMLVPARKGSPLVIGFGKNENFISSDASSLITLTRKVYFMEENEYALVRQKSVSVFNTNNNKVKKIKTQQLNWNIEEVNKGENPHFMIKEIYEQPKIIEKIVANFEEKITTISNSINSHELTVFSGCGTAFNASLIGKYLFSEIANKSIDAIQASEIDFFEKGLSKKDFVVFFSQSGETIDIVESAKRIKKRGISIAAVTNQLGSSLYRLSDLNVLLDAGPEICVLATKSFIAKLAVLILTSYSIALIPDAGKRKLKKTIPASEKILTKVYYNKYIKPIVKRLVSYKNGFVIGRGISYPTALEAALKIKEVSYMHYEAFPGGELKHGVISLINKGTPCFVIAPNDKTYDSIISNASEIKSRGGYIIGISFKPNPIFDWFLPVDDIGYCSVIPISIVTQLVAYYLACLLKLDPDKPRNLAKSVTVK